MSLFEAFEKIIKVKFGPLYSLLFSLLLTGYICVPAVFIPMDEHGINRTFITCHAVFK